MGDYAEYYRNASHIERRHALGTLWRILLLLAIIVTSIVWSYAAQAQTTWTFCAAENATCTFTGTKLVRYGEPWGNAPIGNWSPTRTMTSPVLCNNTTFAPDPSPGTGKQCQIMDAPNPDPGLPGTPVWDTKMTITWAPPTTNTDGTPVCGPLTYRVKVDGVEKAVVTGTSHTITGVAAGLRCATVSAIGSCGESTETPQACATVTLTAPPTPRKCWGKSRGGSGTWEKPNVNAVGFAVYWQCNTPEGWVHEGFIGHWSDLDDDWGQQMAAADTDAKRDALWAARAGKNPAAYYDDVRPLYEALKLANPLPGKEVWTVAKNGTSTSRPAYALVNGARTSTLVGRVGVGIACDCEAHKSGSGASTYCAVTGRANTATAAIDVLPASAAICAKVP